MHTYSHKQLYHACRNAYFHTFVLYTAIAFSPVIKISEPN